MRQSWTAAGAKKSRKGIPTAASKTEVESTETEVIRFRQRKTEAIKTASHRTTPALGATPGVAVETTATTLGAPRDPTAGTPEIRTEEATRPRPLTAAMTTGTGTGATATRTATDSTITTTIAVTATTTATAGDRLTTNTTATETETAAAHQEFVVIKRPEKELRA